MYKISESAYKSVTIAYINTHTHTHPHTAIEREIEKIVLATNYPAKGYSKTDVVLATVAVFV